MDVIDEELTVLRLYYYNSTIKAWRPLTKRLEWDQAIILSFETAYPLKIMFTFELDEFAFLEIDSYNTTTTTTPNNITNNNNNTRSNTRTNTYTTLSDTESSVSRGNLDYIKPPKTSKKISSKLMSSLSLKPPKPLHRSMASMTKSLSSNNIDTIIPLFEKQQKFAKNLEQRLIKTRW